MPATLKKLRKIRCRLTGKDPYSVLIYPVQWQYCARPRNIAVILPHPSPVWSAPKFLLIGYDLHPSRYHGLRLVVRLPGNIDGPGSPIIGGWNTDSGTGVTAEGAVGAITLFSGVKSDWASRARVFGRSTFVFPFTRAPSSG